MGKETGKGDRRVRGIEGEVRNHSERGQMREEAIDILGGAQTTNEKG